MVGWHVRRINREKRYEIISIALILISERGRIAYGTDVMFLLKTPLTRYNPLCNQLYKTVTIGCIVYTQLERLMNL